MADPCRPQLRDANNIMGEVVPAIIAILLDNAHHHWGGMPVTRCGDGEKGMD